MDNSNYIPWNRLVYYVSNVYRETGKFKPGISHGLGEKIRRAAVNISADVNGIEKGNIDESHVYLILSSLSVLETYLQLAKQFKLLKDTRVLNEELAAVREGVLNVLM